MDTRLEMYPSIGLSDLLTHAAPLLAFAAKKERESRPDPSHSAKKLNEELKNFEHDLGLIEKQLVEFSKISNQTLTTEFDNFLHQNYKSGPVHNVIDEADLSRRAEIAGPFTDMSFHPHTNDHIVLKNMYRLNREEAMGPNPVIFSGIQDKSSFTKRLSVVSRANRKLFMKLMHLILENRPQTRPTPAGRPPTTRDRGDATVPDKGNLPLSDQQINPTRSRRRLDAIKKALHSTWPNHQNCSAPGHSHDSLWGRWTDSSSARLRIDPTWQDSKEDHRRYSMLLEAPGRKFRHFKIVISEDGTEPIDSNIHRPICQSNRNPSLEQEICLLMDENRMLWVHKDPWQSDRAKGGSHFEEWSLRRFVPRTELIYKEKLILMFTLATSLRHFLDTDWLPLNWGMDDVSVFYDKHKKELDIRTAYIKADLDKQHAPAGRDHLHRQPRILMLGILLMELLLGPLQPDDTATNVDALINEPVNKATDLYKECEKRFPRALLEPIKSCIDAQLYVFKGEKSTDKLSLRACKTYYMRVVKVLEEVLNREEEGGFDAYRNGSEPPVSALIDETFRPEEEDRPPARSHQSESTNTTLLGSQDSTQELPYYVLASFDRIELPNMVPERKSNWTKQLETLATRSSRGRTGPMESAEFKDLVKVAIIDTGCDPGHGEMIQWLQGWRNRCDKGYHFRFGGIWGWKDFVNVNTEDVDASDPFARRQDIKRPEVMQDLSVDGHGTFMAHLFLKTMPWAKVFIARVFEGSNTTDTSIPDRVQQAVTHAIDKWGVDVISMSFHLLQDPGDLVKSCIQDAANRKNVLFFAAAGNDLHAENRSLGFPANMSEVFCINAHNDNSKRSDFTPNAYDGRPNFCAVGESLQGPDTINAKLRKCMNGTSCATPIAAAYAAMVLDFVKTPTKGDAGTEISKEARDKTLKRLKDVKAMKHIFWSRMTEEGRKLGDHNVVKPGLLFHKSVEGWTDSRVFQELEIGTQEYYTVLH